MKTSLLLSSVLGLNINEADFTLIPDGYHGFFEGWNTTQLIIENEHDEIFHAFEEEVNFVNSKSLEKHT